MAAVDVLVAAGAEATRVSVPEHRTVGLAIDGLEPEGSRAVFDIGFFGAFAKTYYPATLIAATYRLFHEQTDRLMPRGKLNLIVSEFARVRFHGTVYAKAQNVRNIFKKAFDSALGQVDVLAMPTCISVAPKYAEPISYLDVAFRRAVLMNTFPYNFTGHPALTVPCGESNGLPIGIQLVGRYYADPILLQTAYAFQHSVDWEQLTGLPVPAGQLA
jgi:amidase